MSRGRFDDAAVGQQPAGRTQVSCNLPVSPHRVLRRGEGLREVAFSGPERNHVDRVEAVRTYIDGTTDRAPVPDEQPVQPFDVRPLPDRGWGAARHAIGESKPDAKRRTNLRPRFRERFGPRVLPGRQSGRNEVDSLRLVMLPIQ